jgi:hypothetical protein
VLLNRNNQVRTKEYKFLYSLSSYLFEANAHLLSVASNSNVPPPVATALSSCLCLYFALLELIENRR